VNRFCLGLLLVALALGRARAAEVMPPAPPAHFNDYAGIVSSGTASQLDAELDQYERTTSNQILVAIYPKMQSDSSVEDYTVRVAQSWHAGLKGRDNGAVLFVFVQSHQVYIQVGYGLEGALPDARCAEIIANLITPAFRRSAYDQGLTDAVHAMLAAAKGEYTGTGRTVADHRRSGSSPLLSIIVLVVIVLCSILRRRSAVYGSSGRWGSGPWIFPGGGGGFSGGGGGGGGFSGGGGSFGGGGAGGSW